MARTNQRLTPFRTQDARRGQIRRIPTRLSSKVQRDLNKSSLTITEIRQKERKEKELFDKIRDISQNFLLKAKNINELDKLANEFVKQNINRVPQQYQKKLREISKSQAEKIKSNQKQAIKSLEKNISEWQKDVKRFDKKGDTEEDPRKKARFKAREEYFKTLVDEARSIIDTQLSKGEILNLSKVNTFLKDKAKFEQEKRELKEKRDIAKQQAEQKSLEIREYFEKPNVLASPPSVDKIQKDLEVNRITAEKIQEVAKESAKSKVDFVKKIEETVEGGARYDISSLKEAGLSGPEAREVLNKQELENKKFSNQLSKFSNQLQDKLDSVRVESKVNQFLQFVGKQKAPLPQSFLPADIREVTSFKNLNPHEKNVVLTYTGLKNIKENSQKIKENLPDLKQLQAFSNLPTPIISEIGINKNLLKRDKIKDFKLKDVEKISNLSEKEIRKLAFDYGSDKVNNLIKTYNNYSDSVELSREFEKKLSLNRLNEVIRGLEKELNKTVDTRLTPLWNRFAAKEFQIKETKVSQTFNGLAYANELFKLQRKLKKGQGISKKDYNDYLRSAGDILGIKKLTKDAFKNFINKYNTKREKLLAQKDVVAYARNALALLETLEESAKGTVQLIIDWTEYTLTSALASINKTINSIPRLGKKSLNFLIDNGKDLVDVTIFVAENMDRKEKRKLVTRTGKEWKKVYNVLRKTKDVAISIKDLAIEVAKNPYLINLGLASLAVIGSDLLSKALKNLREDPYSATSKIAQYLIEERVFTGSLRLAGATAQQIKAKLSPFVLKNVKVFEDSPTKITTARALLDLDGKTVDLFSASPDKVRKLFKGVDLSKSELNFLVKDMLKNPDKYINANKKIKNLTSIVKSSAQNEIINFIKNNKNIFITGSASLKIQLKNFRNIGDFDIVVKNPLDFGKKLTRYLNNKTVLGKITKIKRYALRPNKRVKGVYEIFDKLTGKKIADIDNLELIRKNFKNILGRKLSNKDFININGVKFVKVESQLPFKLSLSQKTSASFRASKELKDVSLIIKKSKNNLKPSTWQKLKKILNKNDNVLSVKGDIRGLGKDRKYFWAEKYGVNTNQKESKILSQLKKLGFNQADINKNIDLYSQDGFYFGINKIYSYFLKGKKGTVVLVKDFKLSKYPKSIRDLLKKNLAGQLSKSKKLLLRKKLNRFIKNNPDKILPGEKALTDLVGEEEAIAGVFTRLFPKKTFIKREVYVPSLRTFINVQQATIGKRPENVKSLYRLLKNKFKKGYKVKDMKKDILNWAKRNIKGFKDKIKPIDIKKDRAELEKLRKSISDQIKRIRNSKISKTKKRTLINQLSRRRKLLTPRKAKRILVTPSLIRSTNRVIQRASREANIKIPKRTIKRIKSVKRTIQRIPTRDKSRKIKRSIGKVRAPIRATGRQIRKTSLRNPRSVDRSLPSIRAPKRLPKKNIIKKPKIRFEWNKNLPKNRERLVNVLVRVKGKNREIPIRTTPNRALNYITKLVDNTTSRSFSLKTVGLTDKKDVKANTTTKKFRAKKRRSSKVLPFVEKTKFAIDTKGEKRGLTVASLLKTGNRKTKRTTRKKRKSTKSKKSSTKKSSKKKKSIKRKKK